MDAGSQALCTQAARFGRVHHVPVMGDAFLAAGDLQQPGVQRFIPVPVQAGLREGLVECGAVGALGIGQGAVDVEDQGLQHGGFL
jgi:hypothetical protein